MNHTLSEIQNQPVSWRQTIATTPTQWREIANHVSITPATHFIFIGCGTSFYLAQAAARLFQEVTGHTAVAIPGSEVFLASVSTIPHGVPVVAFPISRSGTTSEVLYAVDFLRKHHPHVQMIGVTCHSDSTLAQKAAWAITLDHAAEQSVVMTQSFTNMLLSLQCIAAAVVQRPDLAAELSRLPDALANLMTNAEAFGRSLGESDAYEQYVFLGLGAYYGLAAEATLKLKEMTQTLCEYYNPLEFRHGPISIVGNRTAVVTVVGSREATYVQGVVQDIEALGGYTAVLVPEENDVAAGSVLKVTAGLSDWARTVLYMPALHFLAYSRAVKLGLNPDTPRNLNQVVVL
jgi:glutamine---fructose-6-phosphate transaminase (isomerizing)